MGVTTVFVPGFRVVLRIVRGPLEGMEDFTASCCVVAVIAEVLGEDYRILKHLGFMAPAGSSRTEHITIDTGSCGMNAGHDCYS